MPNYTTLSTSTVNVMVSALKPFQKELDDLKKAKGDKKKIAELEKQIALKTQNVVKKLDADIATAKSGCNQMLLAVEGMLTEGAKALQLAKAVVAQLKSGKRATVAVAQDAPRHLAELAANADAEMYAYGGSWDAYRMFNPALPDGAAKNFSSVRQKIMDDTKSARQKVDKLKALAEEATGLAKEAAALAAGAAASPDESRREAELLHAQVHKMAKSLYEGKTTVENTADLVNRIGGNLQNATDVRQLAQLLVSAEQSFAFTKKAAQTWAATIASMKKAFASGKSAIPAGLHKDGVIAKCLDECTTAIEKAERDAKAASLSLPTLAQAITAAQARVKKGK